MDSVMQYVVRAHGETSAVLQQSSNTLENMITSHASFPFSSRAQLTAEALCRSLLLLTHRCASNFRQAAGRGNHDVIRKALLCPRTGRPTHDDVLDVLCRVQYPMRVAAKGQQMRRPVEDLKPLAERLQSTTKRVLGDKLTSETMQQLGKLVAVFPSRCEHLVFATDVGTDGGVDVEQFVRWALQVST